jgi:hypothetical protein
MTFQKGQGGRKLGAKNRLTNDVRQIFHKVYEEMGTELEIKDPITGRMRKMTGHEAMLNWARENSTEFYRLYGKMIPTTQETQTDNHEDFLDNLVIEGEAEVKELTVTKVDDNGTTIVRLAEPLDIKEVTPQDVNPDTPDCDTHLV